MPLVDRPDNRSLEYLVAGPPDGTPLVFHHGTPGAAVALPALVDAASVRGLRLVTYARPGYGGSTAHPGRSIADAAADTAAVLDALGAGTFVTLGWSGGGPHALACAALLPDRCLAAASVSGVAPYDAEGLDWSAGMAAENLAEFAAAAAGEAEEFADYLARTFRTALGTGIGGWRDDDLAFVRDWGVPLKARCPVSVWHGGQDRMVPLHHGRWLVANWDGARDRLQPGDGHLTLAAAGFADVLDDLLRDA
ncbi:MAG: alpha/beta hydrolase [Actinobacteria bacterium]|nr:MAG: alpha/beta hydrolase [Actinomycetota bacterium]